MRGLFAIVCILSAAVLAAAPFELEGTRLTVTTRRLELVFEEGAVIALRDRRGDDVFAAGDTTALPSLPSGGGVENDGWGFRQLWYKDGPEGVAANEAYQAGRRRPVPGSLPVLTRISRRAVELAYPAITGGAEGDSLRYRFDLDGNEVLIRAEVRLADPEKPPLRLDLPFANLQCPRFLLGAGTRIDATMPDRHTDHCSRPSNNLFSPLIAVLDGRQASIGIMFDAFSDKLDIASAHTPDAPDAIVATAGRDYLLEPAIIRLAPVRVGVYDSWVGAARRYRERFEAATGAKPLWEQIPTWVRAIHAVHTGSPRGVHGSPTVAEANAYYDDLAGLVDPAKLLLFYWNGNGIVLFGDHTYMTRLGGPKQPAIDALKARGFHWMGYHPYTLTMAPNAIPARFKMIEERNYGLPEGYVFNPDYDGPADEFYPRFEPYCAGYYKSMDEAGLWVFHPGSTYGRRYFLRNFGNYCRVHRMDGAYLDICGAGSDHHFPEDRKVYDGMTYAMGEDRMLDEAHQALPTLATMSEVQSTWTVARTFYTWEGASHILRPRQYSSIDIITNHPLRTACWGSYCWTREAGIQPHEGALIGSLPELVTADPWSVARAQLFCTEELYNDLPDEWPEEAVACYRGRDGKQFQFRTLPYGDGFVEVTRAGYEVRLGRFHGVAASPLPGPVTIPGWPAYRDGKPFGLNPARTYAFLTQAPPAPGDLRITALPAGAVVNAVRDHGKNWSSIEFGSTAAEPLTGDVTVRFGRDCLRVAAADGEHAGPFAAGAEATFKTAVPGGLTFVWAEPQPFYGRTRNQFLAASGKLDSRGLADPLWSYQSSYRVVPATVGDVEQRAIEVGSGRHRGYVEQWVILDPDGDPVLHFDLGYPATKGQSKVREHDFAVLVNNRQVWHETVAAGTEWLPREVSLAPWKGRTVLLTLAVSELTDQDVEPGHTEPSSFFGNVYVDNNPVSLGDLDGAALPRPTNVLFADFSTATAIDPAWEVFNSPANVAENVAPTVADGVLTMPHKHYKYQYLARPVDAPNLVVQARLQSILTGCAPDWNPGLCLYWDKGKFAFVTLGGHFETKPSLPIRGVGRRDVPLDGRDVRILADNSVDAWLRLEATAEQIRYLYSLDGRAWQLGAEVPRPPELTGAPRLLIVGCGVEGAGDVFQNDLHHNIGPRVTRVSDLVVGVPE